MMKTFEKLSLRNWFVITTLKAAEATRKLCGSWSFVTIYGDMTKLKTAEGTRKICDSWSSLSIFLCKITVDFAKELIVSEESLTFYNDDARTGSIKEQKISPISMLQPSIAGITDLIGLIGTISELKLPKLKETVSVERTIESCGGFRSGGNGENFFSTFDLP